MSEPTIRYIVTKRFKYAGKWLEPNAEFIPTGGRFDAQIIGQGKMVRRIESAVEESKRNRRRVTHASA